MKWAYNEREIVGYMDFIVIMTRSVSELKQVTCALVNEVYKMELQLNKKMQNNEDRRVAIQRTSRVDICGGKMKFKETEYLGARITSKCQKQKEIEARVIKAKSTRASYHLFSGLNNYQ